MPRPEPLRVTVTNDDGIDSTGLRLLAAAALRTGCKVLVAAPDHRAPDHRASDHRASDHRASGSSAAMAAVRDGRIVMERRKLAGLDTVPAYAVQATPAFIAFTAVREAFGRQPDFLLAGINLGPSTGQAILHSGTVGAAMAAASYGVRAAAFSLDADDDAAHLHWETAAAVATQVILALPDLPRGEVLNVNIPNVPQHMLRGIRRGQLAAFGAVQTDIIEAAEDHLQVTVSERAAGPVPGTDSGLLAAGYASVTPLLPVSEAPAPWLPWPAVTGAGMLAHP
ncbi:MAG: 5/3-nucleotidase [Streptosporangiaceae bacterium]|nr:5/3-nucleotidase [Streptosporangiaceae bacterium]